jgi:carboxyl-terminal processing protease
LNSYKTVENFIAKFEVGNDLINQLITFAENEKINKPTTADLARSEGFIKQQLKALIARQIWRDGGYFKVNSMKDKTIQKAILELSK